MQIRAPRIRNAHFDLGLNTLPVDDTRKKIKNTCPNHQFLSKLNLRSLFLFAPNIASRRLHTRTRVWHCAACHLFGACERRCFQRQISEGSGKKRYSISCRKHLICEPALLYMRIMLYSSYYTAVTLLIVHQATRHSSGYQ